MCGGGGGGGGGSVIGGGSGCNAKCRMVVVVR